MAAASSPRHGRAMMPALLDAYLAELASMRATLADDEAAGLAAGLRQLLLALEGEVSSDDD